MEEWNNFWKKGQLKKKKLLEIKKLIKDTGDFLIGKLPPSKYHKRRNSHAHIYQMIKSKYGKSYKNVEDLDDLIKFIKWLKENPC